MCPLEEETRSASSSSSSSSSTTAAAEQQQQYSSSSSTTAAAAQQQHSNSTTTALLEEELRLLGHTPKPHRPVLSEEGFGELRILWRFLGGFHLRSREEQLVAERRERGDSFHVSEERLDVRALLVRMPQLRAE